MNPRKAKQSHNSAARAEISVESVHDKYKEINFTSTLKGVM